MRAFFPFFCFRVNPPWLTVCLQKRRGELTSELGSSLVRLKEWKEERQESNQLLHLLPTILSECDKNWESILSQTNEKKTNEKVRKAIWQSSTNPGAKATLLIRRGMKSKVFRGMKSKEKTAGRGMKSLSFQSSSEVTNGGSLQQDLCSLAAPGETAYTIRGSFRRQILWFYLWVEIRSIAIWKSMT